MDNYKGKHESGKTPVSRRVFLGILAGAAAVIGGVISLDSILPKNSGPEANTSKTTVTKAASDTSTVSLTPSATRVVVVRGTTSVDPQVFIDKALEALGGVERLVPTGANILVKPNVGFYEKDATTDPRITAAVINALKRVRPNQIVVGESALRGIDVEQALQVTGTRSLAEAAGS